jgi:hypothetical protein
MPSKLRIAASVLFGLLAVALAVLWVRSYWRCDFIYRCSMMGPYANIKVIGSEGGYLYFKSDIQLGGPGPTFWTPVIGEPAQPATYRWVNERRTKMFMTPHYYLVAMFLAVAAAPWIRFRKRRTGGLAQADCEVRK